MAKHRKKIKNPDTQTGLNHTKKKASPNSNPDKQFLSFRLDCQGKYCLNNCEDDEIVAFAKKMHLYGKVTWQEVYLSPRHGLGCEKISRESSSVPIPSFVPEDVNILALRFKGLAAMVGWRKDNTFHVLGFDRNFTMYDHG